MARRKPEDTLPVMDQAMGDELRALAAHAADFNVHARRLHERGATVYVDTDDLGCLSLQVTIPILKVRP